MTAPEPGLYHGLSALDADSQDQRADAFDEEWEEYCRRVDERLNEEE